ncbi:hypothetical protein ACFQ4Z_17430 [Oceanobacillus oncorhynchi subsp. oncorhynchi]|uniref:hypothetical protein n=1 Tax=Oceanobacillus oncorhynchi TaxID=545501 RepID=UPI0031D8C150
MGQNTITLDPDERKATSIPEIEKEYARLDEDWLRFHYKLSIWLVIFILSLNVFSASSLSGQIC